MTKYALLFWLMLAGGHLANAQLNESDSIPLQMKFTTTGSYLDGVVNRLLLVNRAEIAYSRPTWGFSSRNDYQFGRTFYRQTENDVLSYNFLYLKPMRRSYPYLMLLVETHYRRKINFRYQPGIGISYNLIQTPHNLLKVSLTGSFEHSKFGGTNFDNYQNTDPTNDVIETWRATGRVFGRHRLLNNRLRLLYEVWFQQSVLDGANFRYHTDDALEFPLSKKVAFRLGFRYTFENVKLVGNKPYDLFLTYGITLANF
ncbi:MAG: DUF481 domain-containing protein [Cytophagales bacterium]|nr:MAG: DUF481 domain-containing protein [Cytophagales bacterium]